MRTRFGHLGDAFEAIREIYDSLPEGAEQKAMLKELAEKLADLMGETENMEFHWSDLANHKK